MPRQVALRFFLACAVLLAQQTALAHQYWHAALKAPAEKSLPAKGDKLCDFHDLLGTVLGVADGSPAVSEFPSLAQTVFTAPAVALREALPLAPHSRDPPLAS
jgi:hypothetical protein